MVKKNGQNGKKKVKNWSKLSTMVKIVKNYQNYLGGRQKVREGVKWYARNSKVAKLFELIQGFFHWTVCTCGLFL